MMNKRLLRDCKAACYSKNPVFVQGAALTVLVMASTSLATAGVVSLAMTLTVLPSLLLAGFLGKKLSQALLLPALALLNAVAYLPVSLLMNFLFPMQTYSAGLYLPLIVLCGTSLFWDGEGKKHAFLPLPARIIQLLSFPFILCAAAYLREHLGKGALAGANLPGESIPGLFLPFSGFLVLGFVLAFLQFVHLAVKRLSHMGKYSRASTRQRKGRTQAGGSSSFSENAGGS